MEFGLETGVWFQCGEAADFGMCGQEIISRSLEENRNLLRCSITALKKSEF